MSQLRGGAGAEDQGPLAHLEAVVHVPAEDGLGAAFAGDAEEGAPVAQRMPGPVGAAGAQEGCVVDRHQLAEPAQCGQCQGGAERFEVRVNNVPTDPSPYVPPKGPNDFRG